jgi:hypothetical protein
MVFGSHKIQESDKVLFKLLCIDVSTEGHGQPVDPSADHKFGTL